MAGADRARDRYGDAVAAFTLARTGFVLDAEVAGPDDGPLVLLLHGFPQTNHTYRLQLPALAAAGFRAVAPNQRGYAAGARPDTGDLGNYALGELVADVVDLADACGAERFHLVGHDWGGQVAWATAAAHPDRVRSLTVLSRPHPAAFRAAMQGDPGQADRSKHHKAFLDPTTADRLLEDGARRLRTMLAHANVPGEAIDAYLSVLGDRPALDAALAWYRAAAGNLGSGVGPVAVPTLYVWGDADQSVGRAAAEGTAAHVTGAFRFVELPGIGHFVTDEVVAEVNEPLLAHVRAW